MNPTSATCSVSLFPAISSVREWEQFQVAEVKAFFNLCRYRWIPHWASRGSAQRDRRRPDERDLFLYGRVAPISRAQLRGRAEGWPPPRGPRPPPFLYNCNTAPHNNAASVSIYLLGVSKPGITTKAGFNVLETSWQPDWLKIFPVSRVKRAANSASLAK